MKWGLGRCLPRCATLALPIRDVMTPGPQGSRLQRGPAPKLAPLAPIAPALPELWPHLPTLQAPQAPCVGRTRASQALTLIVTSLASSKGVLLLMRHISDHRRSSTSSGTTVSDKYDRLSSPGCGFRPICNAPISVEYEPSSYVQHTSSRMSTPLRAPCAQIAS